jgi:hypothetical protein
VSSIVIFALRFQPDLNQSADEADHCFSSGALTPLGGAAVDGGGRASGAAAAAAQSPAHILVPLTVPTNLQPIGACGFS